LALSGFPPAKVKKQKTAAMTDKKAFRDALSGRFGVIRDLVLAAKVILPSHRHKSSVERCQAATKINGEPSCPDFRSWQTGKYFVMIGGSTLS
jgi:hypothetical protein